MTPLIRKEIRLLLPFMAIALFLAATPPWFFPEESSVGHVNEFVFWAFGFGMMLLGLAPFGEEFSMGTFSSLLAQPLKRNRIWLTKLLLLSAAAVLVLLVLIVSVHLRLDSILKDVTQRLTENEGNRVWNLSVQKSVSESLHSLVFWRIGFTLVLVGLAGGLWTTLLFRQTGAALWFTILVPGVIFVCIDWFLPANSARQLVFFAIFAIYSIAGVFWARRMFLEAQDVQWLGGTISISGLSRTEKQTESAMTRRRKPWRALLGKEIQSQQINLLIAFGLLVLHLCTLAFRGLYTLPKNSDLRFVVESVPFLWLLLPWLLGSVAVAEERKLGMLESQLCLPFSRRRQFAVKLGAVLPLGFVLGAIVPCAIELVGILCHVNSGVFSNFSLTPNSDANDAFIVFCAAAPAIATVSLLASSLTRNTLHALGASVVFCGVCAALLDWTNWEIHEGYIWSGSLIYIIGVPVSIVTVVWLSLSNYKRLHAGRNVWLRNLFVFLASLVLSGTATAFIYQRPCELMMTLEPRHSSAHLNGPVKPVICAADDRVLALLPSGRLWAATDYHREYLDEYEGTWSSHGIERQQLWVPIPDDGVFVGGSDWVALAAGSAEVAAIQSDGSLWRVLSWRDKTNSFSWKFWLSLPPEPRRLGTDNDWKAVVASYDCFIALKTDGTLWSWGFNQLSPVGSGYIKDPTRIDTHSDWAAIFSQEDRFLFVKRNGEVWTPERLEGKRFDLRRTDLNGSDWLDVAGFSNSSFFLHKDGTLWVQGFHSRVVFGSRNPMADQQYAGNPFRIGHDSDWSQISLGSHLVALKKDGRLLESHQQLFSSWLGQPSKYSDWIAINSSRIGLVALAADGTVSVWWDNPSSSVLGPTHRPLWSLNVLTSSE